MVQLAEKIISMIHRILIFVHVMAVLSQEKHEGKDRKSKVSPANPFATVLGGVHLLL